MHTNLSEWILEKIKKQGETQKSVAETLKWSNAILLNRRLNSNSFKEEEAKQLVDYLDSEKDYKEFNYSLLDCSGRLAKARVINAIFDHIRKKNKRNSLSPKDFSIFHAQKWSLLKKSGYDSVMQIFSLPKNKPVEATDSQAKKEMCKAISEGAVVTFITPGTLPSVPRDTTITHKFFTQLSRFPMTENTGFLAHVYDERLELPYKEFRLTIFYDRQQKQQAKALLDIPVRGEWLLCEVEDAPSILEVINCELTDGIEGIVKPKVKLSRSINIEEIFKSS